MLRSLLITVAILALLVGCEDSENLRVRDTTSKLVGTWQREDAGNIRAQRTLVLASDGKFVEKIDIVQSDQTLRRVEFAGEWSYDGTNLKLRFFQENGRKYSGGSMRFATSPLLSVNAAEFVVDDSFAKTKATYRRTAGVHAGSQL